VEAWRHTSASSRMALDGVWLRHGRAGVKDENGYYGHIGWNTWLRLRDYKAGALVEEYRTGEPYLAHVGYSIDIHWIRLTPFGEHFYRENWQSYRDLYPDVDAPAPGE